MNGRISGTCTSSNGCSYEVPEDMDRDDIMIHSFVAEDVEDFPLKFTVHDIKVNFFCPLSFSFFVKLLDLKKKKTFVQVRVLLCKINLNVFAFWGVSL